MNKLSYKRIITVLTFPLILNACSTGQSPSPTATILVSSPDQPQIVPSDTLEPFPVVTAGAITLEAAITLTPAPTVETGDDQSESIPSSTPTQVPVITPIYGNTATPTIPLDSIYEVLPGPGSKVTSPINLEAYIIIGEDDNITITLYGEDGRILNRQVYRYAGMNYGVRFPIIKQIDFEIPSVSEAARLVLSTQDNEGRMMALTSTDLILMSIGDSEINSTSDYSAPIFISYPKDNQAFQGGNLTVSGMIQPLSDEPVIIELLSDTNQALVSRQIDVTTTTSDEPISFQVDMPYTISHGMYARIVAHQAGGRIYGDLDVDSVKVYLYP